MEQRSDEQLVKEIQNGDIETFGVLIDRYEDKMFRYVKRFISDKDNAVDLVQEVFIKTYENIDDFDTEKRFSPWIYRIAHNAFVNALRKQKKYPIPFFDLDLFFPNFQEKETPEDLALQEELKKELHEGIDKINLRYKEALVLYYFEELSYKEIADVLHIPVATVGARISRGKDAIRKIMRIQETL